MHASPSTKNAFNVSGLSFAATVSGGGSSCREALPGRCRRLQTRRSGHFAALERGITDDARALMDTPSFLDRLRHTGVVSPAAAASHGALGPVGRGSGLGEDVRSDRPYGAYSLLGFQPAETSEDGDALARQQIRLDEITTSFHLIREALDEFGEEDADGPWRLPMQPVEGIGLGWVEAPQGELVYLVEAEAGRLKRVKQRSASFHNLALFPQAFGGDILTDFVFIEASFGLSISGVAG